MAKRDGTVDLRIKRTQKSIKNAFYELIEEKGFDHISVKDITERAMISRNTFYLHYNDKFDLLNKICDELVFKLFIGLGLTSTVRQALLKWELKPLKRTERLTGFCFQAQVLICLLKSCSKVFDVRLTLSAQTLTA